MIEQGVRDSQHPLCQFPTLGQNTLTELRPEALLERLVEMGRKEIGLIIHNQRAGPIVNACECPSLIIGATIQPITGTALRVRLSIRPDYRWNDRAHGISPEPFLDVGRRSGKQSDLSLRIIFAQQEASGPSGRAAYGLHHSNLRTASIVILHSNRQ